MITIEQQRADAEKKTAEWLENQYAETRNLWLALRAQMPAARLRYALDEPRLETDAPLITWGGGRKTSVVQIYLVGTITEPKVVVQYGPHAYERKNPVLARRIVEALFEGRDPEDIRKIR